MSLEIDYLPVATATGANVDTQADFAGSSYQTLGFQNGIALPDQFNKILRQCSMMTAALANLISNTMDIAVLDDGNLPELITNLQNTMTAIAIPVAASGPAAVLQTVEYSATPEFNSAAGSAFDLVLTGPVTSSTFINGATGANIVGFRITQNATGNFPFVWPANVRNAGAVNLGANMISTQLFMKQSDGSLDAAGPMMYSTIA
jgi:hypothetical protein